MRRVLLTLGGLALVAITSADVPRAVTVASTDKAKEALRRFLVNGETMPMTAIVVQRAGSLGAESIQVKVQQDSSGRRRVVVLGPLSMQGSVSVDDGLQWVNFCPDTSRMMVAPSPRDERMDPEYRLSLAQQNYRFAVEKNTELAGRPAVVVIAIPRNSSMPTRRIGIDADRGVLLRLEAIRQTGQRDVLYDTRSIAFSGPTSADTFKIHPTGNVRVIRMDPPAPVSTPNQAKSALGFTPIFPPRLRYGFVVRESELVGPRSGRYLAHRITDGIVSATLYQWNANQRISPIGPDMEGVDRTIGSVAMRVVGEAPRDVRIRMIEGIAYDLGKTFRPTSEPVWTTSALKPGREPAQRFQSNVSQTEPSIFETLLSQ